MEFHIARAARARYGVEDALFNYVGNVVFADVTASRRLAAKMSAAREAEAQAGEIPEPVNAGALFAMGLIDELSHALVARYRKEVDPEVLPAALEWFAAGVTEANVDTLLRSFTDEFPNTAIYKGEQTISGWLEGTTDGQPNREAELEELMLLSLANANPAYKPFGELFDAGNLEKRTVYKQVTSKLGDFFATRPPVSPDQGTLYEVLMAPILASPDSLSGQLDYIREHWVPLIGEELRHVLLAQDVLREEEVAIWMRFHPPAPGGDSWTTQNGPKDWGIFGFEGDEYRGFEGLQSEREQRLARLARKGQPAEPVVDEYEAFSQDQAWMPTVVLIAKSTYVWLEQLSKQYGRHIHRLDQIPQEELHLLAGRGMNGLWLIGLWERSVASQTIKRMRGQADAVASAYSLRDYRIAEDLGGEPAYEVLRDRARAAGIRLASDMVPNHMGIDSTWVIEHPEWFVSRPESPFPVYSFNGPDLSPDGRVEIRIEDHYFDQTDAAVVFQLKDRRNGRTEYMFHGNDGTTFAWNDTAQLNYSKAAVREQVIQTILEVAKLFPIIRFDAAMTLAKKHVQRLWFPLPGEGRSIPSRAEDAMTQEEFDALMPHEFWREVVDRVAVEVPGTLLLAEAFWLLEGYFVRTLGMHRVYNSAFMNMLRDEENAKYRSYLKKTIEFDPDIMKRYVNFMSNPDERTAIDQFGSGDKYFGCCTLMATLPGLPMFGHGQVEGYTERYGMEYKRAKFDEWPNQDLVARHQREIMPLLKDRSLFAESAFFRMYDFNNADGVDESVFAFSNREGSRRAAILFNNRYGSTHGTIHWSVEQMDKGSGTMHGETLGDALRLPWEDGAMLRYRDSATGLEYLRWSQELRERGLTFDLRGYQYVVLLDWQDVYATAERPWDQLCNALAGQGVRSLDDELTWLRLRPTQDALRATLDRATLEGMIATAGEAPQAAAEDAEPEDEVAEETVQQQRVAEPLTPEPITVAVAAEAQPAASGPFEPMVARAEAFYRAAEQAGELPEGSSFTARATIEDLLTAAASLSTLAAGVETGHALPLGRNTGSSVVLWAPVFAWAVLQPLGEDGAERVDAFDRLRLRDVLAGIFGSLGMLPGDEWRAAARVRLLLEFGEVGNTLPDAFWERPDARWLAGINENEGKSYFNKEASEELIAWMALPSLLQEPEQAAEELAAAYKAARLAGYRLDLYLAGKTAEDPIRVVEPVAQETVEEAADPAFRA